MYFPSSENKGADQLRCFREADLRLCFAYAKSRFSCDEAHMTSMFYAAQSLVMLQTLYGIIPNLHGKGECAKVCNLENEMTSMF